MTSKTQLIGLNFVISH